MLFAGILLLTCSWLAFVRVSQCWTAGGLFITGAVCSAIWCRAFSFTVTGFSVVAHRSTLCSFATPCAATWSSRKYPLSPEPLLAFNSSHAPIPVSTVYSPLLLFKNPSSTDPNTSVQSLKLSPAL
jgi:hypothetical protein